MSGLRMAYLAQAYHSKGRGGAFLCGYHQGSYETIGTAIERIRKEKGEYRLADWEVNFNILDQFVERDSSRFITEIQIPILVEA